MRSNSNFATASAIPYCAVNRGIALKTLTLWQPFASAILLGLKRFETRGRRTNHRGLLAIHAAKRTPDMGVIEQTVPLLTTDQRRRIPQRWPTGCVLGTVQVRDCLTMDAELIESIDDPIELALGDWQPGRFAYLLSNARIFVEPVEARGLQGIWEWDGEPPRSIPVTDQDGRWLTPPRRLHYR